MHAVGPPGADCGIGQRIWKGDSLPRDSLPRRGCVRTNFHPREGNPYATPDRDPDHDGRDNLAGSLALTVPTDPSSFFDLHAMRTPGQPGKVDLVFGPIRNWRT